MKTKPVDRERLRELLTEAVKRELLTEEEIEEQKRSWVRANLGWGDE